MTPAAPLRRIGLLGGSFDPPHAGHLAAARFVRERFELERIDLVPSLVPPHKPGQPLSHPFHRYAMTVLATLQEEAARASFLELERGGVSYTIDTLLDVRASSPGADVVFVLGTDQFAEMAGWREPRRIVEEFGLVVVDRPGNGFEEALGRLPDFVAAAASRGRVLRAEMEPVELSSTRIRRRVSLGESISGLVTPAVAQYIDRYGLYRSGG